jgi:hypothetical protein
MKRIRIPFGRLQEMLYTIDPSLVHFAEAILG